MRATLVWAGVLSAVAVLVIATVWSRDASHVVAARESQTLAASAPPNSSAPSEDGRTRGQNRLARDEAAVRLDGREIAVLRYGELPPNLAMVTAPDHEVARYFRVADYVKALGVPLAEVRAVHFLGNRGRVASIEGAELREKAAALVFDFTRTTEGAPAVMWDTRGLRNPKRIDFIRGVEIFVAKQPRAINLDVGCYESQPPCSEEAIDEPSHGVRVYLDGRIAATVKRRDASSMTTLADALVAQQIPIESIRGVEIISSDAVVERAEGVALSTLLRAISLESSPRDHGRVLAHTGRSKYVIEAILLYRRGALPERPAATPVD